MKEYFKRCMTLEVVAGDGQDPDRVKCKKVAKSASIEFHDPLLGVPVVSSDDASDKRLIPNCFLEKNLEDVSSPPSIEVIKC